MSQLVLANILAGSGNVLAGGDNGGNVTKVTIGSNLTLSGGVLSATGGGSGSVTSVGLTTSATALTITNSPITTSGNIGINFAGTSSQYVRGDGTLATLPTVTGYVPYTGATQNLDLGTYGLLADFVGFNTSPTSIPTTQGTLSWNVDKESLDLIMNGTTGSLMQDTFYNVKNQTGAAIPKGTVVRADGTFGASGRIKIAPFLADGTYSSKYCMGVTAETIADGADGKVLAFGALRKIDTSAYTNGTILYASPTTAGAFTTTEPSNPNNIVTLAIVVYSDNTNGEIFVRPTFVPSQAELILSLGYTPANDANVVKLTGNQTVGGVKTFSSESIFGGGITLTGGDLVLKSGDYNTTINTDTLTESRSILFPDNSGTVALLTDIDYPVLSVFGRTGDVVAASGDYDTDMVDEGTTNLYYTNARARAALSANTGSALTYNNTTGRFTLNAAESGVDGYLTGTDYDYFDAKQNSLGTGTTSQFLRGDLVWAAPAPISLDEISDVDYVGTPSTGQLLRYRIDHWENWTPTYVAAGFFSATAPLSYNSTTGVFSISQATTSTNGYLSSTDWNTFNGKEPAITAGTTTQYWRGDKTWQTLNTTAVTEGTNLYYTDGRARGALSFTAGSGAYNSTTGVITIPTNNNQITNGAGYITASALSAYLPLTGGTLTGTLNVNTPGGMSVSLGGIVSGWAGNNTYPTIWGSAAERYVMHLNPHLVYTQNGYNSYTGSMNGATIRMASDSSATTYWDIGIGTNSVGADKFSLGRAGSSLISLTSGGNFLIGTTTDAGYKLDVNGTGRLSGGITTSAYSYLYGLRISGNDTGNTIYAGNASMGITAESGNTIFIGSSNLTTGFRVYTSTGAATFSNNLTLDGATNPTLRLNGAAGGSPTIRLDQNGVNKGWMYLTSGGILQINNNATDGQGIAVNNNIVGINTSSPLFSGFAQLTVNGTQGGIVIQGSSSGYSRLFFAKDDTSNVEGLIRYYHSDNSMQFFTNANERLRITSGGNILIGTTTDAGAKLQVYGGNYNAMIGARTTWAGASYPTLYNSSSAEFIMIHLPHLPYLQNGVNGYIGTSYGAVVRMASNTSASAYWDAGIVAGIGTDVYGIQRNGSTLLTLSSSAALTSYGGFFESSDKRLKEELKDNPTSVNIENIKPKLYIKNGKEELGYYAQDFLNILPSAVEKGSDDYYILSYAQVHTAKIAYLENKIEELEELIKRLIK